MARTRVLGLLLGLTLVACGGGGGGGGGGPTDPPATATLSGTVHVLGSTTLVEGVVVSAQGFSTTTNANGAFSLNGLVPRSTAVMLTRQGYVPLAITVNLAAGANSFSIAIEPS